MTNLLSLLAQRGGDGGGSIVSFALLPLMLVAMYFLIIRPNSKRRKDAAKLQSVLNVGDEVMTTSGIVGTITGEDGDSRFWLEIDNDVQVRIGRGHIQGKIAPDAPDAPDDADADSATDVDDEQPQLPTGDDEGDSKKSVDGD